MYIKSLKQLRLLVGPQPLLVLLFCRLFSYQKRADGPVASGDVCMYVRKCTRELRVMGDFAFFFLPSVITCKNWGFALGKL